MDLHREEFDGGTQDKLELLREYLQAAIPVYFQQRYWNEIFICDFFCGPGEDPGGNPGSPRIIYNIVTSEKNMSFLEANNKKVTILLNEFDTDKFTKLDSWVKSIKKTGNIKIVHFKHDFLEALKIFYNEYYNFDSSIGLLFFDQNGYKYLNQKMLNFLCDMKRVDWIFFTATNYLKQFYNNPGAKQIYDSSFLTELSRSPNYLVHRLVAEEIKKWVVDENVYLSNFTIKKDTGKIYGLIFGATNIKANQLFVTACWRMNPVSGDSNYDIDDDNIDLNQSELFPRYPKRLEVFDKTLRENILNRTIDSNLKLYIFTVVNGFLPKHANECFRKMIKEKLVKDPGALNLDYDLVKGIHPEKKIEVLVGRI